jgi:hypothetical protein
LAAEAAVVVGLEAALSATARDVVEAAHTPRAVRKRVAREPTTNAGPAGTIAAIEPRKGVRNDVVD